jgi:hypothetical protein
MAEKAFKVPSLGLVGTTAELDFASGDLRWNALPLATESYVDTAVGNVTVNVEALAGNYLAYDSGNNELDVNINALAGSGLVVSADQLAVDTSTFATKTYVDGVVQGLDVKEAVKTASTANITLSGEGTKEDGQWYGSVDRVLVKNQSTAADNGIYIVNKNGAWTRAADFDPMSPIGNFGSFVFVKEGTNAGKGFVYSSADTWTQFSEAGSYITDSDAPFFVQAGNLSLNTTSSLYVDGLTNQLDVNTNIIATKSYVDTAVGNVTVNVEALAGDGLTFDALTNTLDFKKGNGLSYSMQGFVDVNTTVVAADLAGAGLAIPTMFAENGILAVNTNTIATELVGTGLYVANGNDLTVNVNALAVDLAGAGLAIPTMFAENGILAVNTNTIATQIVGTGLYVANGNDLTVNVNAIAGNGAEAFNHIIGKNYNGVDILYVNTNTLAGSGLFSEYGAVAVNVNAVGTAIAGDGLSFSGGTLSINRWDTSLILNSGKLLVNTNVIATRAYVDAVAEGLHIHASVVAATVNNIALASAVEAGQTLDGVTLVAGDRILVKNQTTQSENGIYIVQASGQPTRATDFDTATEVDSGDFVFVSGGTTQAATGWVQTNKPATIGTDAIVFSQFSGAGTYVGGDGLTLTGNTFSVNAGSGLYITSDNLAVNTNAISTAIASGQYNSHMAVFNGDKLYVNSNSLAEVMAGSNLYVESNDNLTVNTNAIATSLAGTGLYVANGDDLVVNTNAIATSLADAPYGYGASWTFFLKNDGGKNVLFVNTVTKDSANSNVYVTVGNLPSPSSEGINKPAMFDAEVIVTIDNKSRSSRISGMYLADDTAEYTEYAIVEVGGTITDFDLKVDTYGLIQVKGEIGSGKELKATAAGTLKGMMS